MTIDSNVAVDFDPEKMRAQEPDPLCGPRLVHASWNSPPWCRTSCSESIELGETDYREAKSAAEVEAVTAAAKKPGGMLAIALETSAAEPVVTVEVEVADEPEPEQLSLTAAPQAAPQPAASRRVAISRRSRKGADARRSTTRSWRNRCSKPLADESMPKTVHDYKSAMHVFAQLGWTLAGVQHDPLLYGYLLDPTYSTYGLRESALRLFNLKLGPSPAEAADITLRLTDKLRERN